jgi:hypothetical protein
MRACTRLAVPVRALGLPFPCVLVLRAYPRSRPCTCSVRAFVALAWHARHSRGRAWPHRHCPHHTRWYSRGTVPQPPCPSCPLACPSAWFRPAVVVLSGWCRPSPGVLTWPLGASSSSYWQGVVLARGMDVDSRCAATVPLAGCRMKVVSWGWLRRAGWNLPSQARGSRHAYSVAVSRDGRLPWRSSPECF